MRYNPFKYIIGGVPLAINQLKIVISLLREFLDGNKPTAYDYDISGEEYWNIVESMQDEGLIKGVSVVRAGQGNKVQIGFLDDTKVTIKGIEYLNKNSALAKTYRGLKEIREWLPF